MSGKMLICAAAALLCLAGCTSEEAVDDVSRIGAAIGRSQDRIAARLGVQEAKDPVMDRELEEAAQRVKSVFVRAQIIEEAGILAREILPFSAKANDAVAGAIQQSGAAEAKDGAMKLAGASSAQSGRDAARTRIYGE